MKWTSNDQSSREYVYLLMGISLLFQLGSTVVNPVLPLQITSVGASEVELGWIVSLLTLTCLFFRIPLTVLTSRFGTRRVILLSVVGRLLALTLYALAPSTPLLYPARVLDGMGLALMIPVLIGQFSRRSLGLSTGGAMGRFATSYGLALTLGPLICGVLLEYLTYSQVILAAISFQLLALLTLSRVRPEYLNEQSYRANGGRTDERVFDELKRIIRSRNLALLAFIGVTYSVGRGFVSAFFTVYVVNDLGLSPTLAAWAFVALGVANLIVRFPTGALSHRVGKRKPLVLAFATTAAALFLLARYPLPFLLVLTMGLIGAGWGIQAVASLTILSESVEEQDMKIAAAYHSNAYDAGMTLGAISSGFLASAFSISITFLIGSGLVLVVLLSILLRRRWPVSTDENIRADIGAPT